MACNKCEAFREKSGSKVRQTIKDRTRSIRTAVEALQRSELSPSDYKSMYNFVHQSDKYLSSEGMELKHKVQCVINYYDEVQKQSSSVKSEVCSESNGMVPSKEKFLKNFMKLYNSDNDQHRNSLVFVLLEAYVAKASGHMNPEYGVRLTNFCLALAATNRRAFEFVSGNLCLMSLRQAERLCADRRATPFIFVEEEEMKSMLLSFMKNIRERSGDDSTRVVFSIGIDATATVKGFQYLADKACVVGGAAPNHRLEVETRSKSDVLRNFLKDCLDGKKGEEAAECKIAVASFQHTPPGICPYLILSGRPQTINESNSFAADMMRICNAAAASDGNAVLLNDSTDGVSCEMVGNYNQICLFLEGKSHQLSFPDTNHIIKCLRYLLVGGSSAASIGRYVFDPMLFKMTGTVPKHLVRIDDFSADNLVLALASPKVVAALSNLDTDDDGNATVSFNELLVYPTLFTISQHPLFCFVVR